MDDREVRANQEDRMLQGHATNHLQLVTSDLVPSPRTRPGPAHAGLDAPSPFVPALHLIEVQVPPPVPSRERPTT